MRIQGGIIPPSREYLCFTYLSSYLGYNVRLFSSSQISPDAASVLAAYPLIPLSPYPPSKHWRRQRYSSPFSALQKKIHLLIGSCEEKPTGPSLCSNTTSHLLFPTSLKHTGCWPHFCQLRDISIPSCSSEYRNSVATLYTTQQQPCFQVQVHLLRGIHPVCL